VIRVLHVDDEAPIRLLSRINLEAKGMEVIEAADGLIGVQLAQREQPDLILLGVMMPVLDGWQAAEQLRTDPETREIPIVFLTARSELRDCARGFDLGAVDYILKPFNPEELASRIRGLLERLERGERDELRRENFSELRALIVDDLAARAISRADFMRFLDALRGDLKMELARPEGEVPWGARELVARRSRRLPRGRRRDWRYRLLLITTAAAATRRRVRRATSRRTPATPSRPAHRTGPWG
jgi:DNA-binding response OmpR family regulator